jgi:tetratricopeptide (TPR) repeat protein
VLTFLAYLDTLSFQFVQDDEYQILGNVYLRSWSYLPRYFTKDVWAFMHPNYPGNYYRPLFLLWLRLNYLLFGLHPWGWHLTTVLAHVGATLLVYRLARRLLGDWVTAVFAALVFGLHPVHIEGVAWISGVSEPLLALLLIPSFLCHLNVRDNPRRARAWLAASLGLYGLAMLVKETALVLPLLIFASAGLGLQVPGLMRPESWRRRLGASLGSAAPYLALTVIYLLARQVVLKGFQNPNADLPVSTIVFTWPSLLWFYLRHLVWPAGLCPFYGLEYVDHPHLGNVVLPGTAVVLAALGLAWWAKRSQRAALAAMWLALPVLPVLNIQVFGSGHFAHDRYLYLPSVGFCMLAALALRQVKLGRTEIRGQPALQVGLVLVLACALGVSTTSQDIYYANRTLFYMHSHAGAPNNDALKTTLAGLLGEQGHLDEAVKLYQQVLEHDPNSWLVNYDLGYAYYLLGKVDQAERYLGRATQLAPLKPGGYFYLGLTELKMGRYAGAAANIRRALAISPDTDNYHFALGIVLKLQGDLQGAREEFQAELTLNPRHAAAREQMAEIDTALRSRQPEGVAASPVGGPQRPPPALPLGKP